MLPHVEHTGREERQVEEVHRTQKNAEEALYPLLDRDPELTERLRAAGIRVATHSLDRPRHVAKHRPRWLAFFLRVVGVRG